MKFLKDGLSIDETRISILVLAFAFTLGFALYQVITIGDFSDNLLVLLGYEIMAVTGVNVADSIMMNKKNKATNTVIENNYSDSNDIKLP